MSDDAWRLVRILAVAFGVFVTLRLTDHPAPAPRPVTIVVDSGRVIDLDALCAALDEEGVDSTAEAVLAACQGHAPEAPR